MTGIELITEERQRQIGAEGWTPEHDAEHSAGELAMAAVSYALPPDARTPKRGTSIGYYVGLPGPPFSWPWSPQWWRRLEAAGVHSLDHDRVLPLPSTVDGESLCLETASAVSEPVRQEAGEGECALALPIWNLRTEGYLVERRLRGQHIEPPRPVNLSAYWKARKAG
jgi:hypothetical protein